MNRTDHVAYWYSRYLDAFRQVEQAMCEHPYRVDISRMCDERKRLLCGQCELEWEVER